jgi:hypothetical protein
LDSFLYEAARTLKSFQKFKTEIKKPIAVDVLFKAYPMVPPPSCSSNLAGWYPQRVPFKRCQKDVKIGRFSVPGNTGESADTTEQAS